MFHMLRLMNVSVPSLHRVSTDLLIKIYMLSPTVYNFQQALLYVNVTEYLDSTFRI